MNEHDISKASEELGQNGDELPEIHYLPTSKQKYWKQDDRGQWIGYGVGEARRYLSVGCELKSDEVNEVLYNAESNKVLDIVTKIGGYKKGLHDIDGKRVLVPSEQRRIDLVEGRWSTLEAVLLGMLGEEQLEWYCGWVKHWMEGFYAYADNAGQVLALVGPPSCGKSLLLDLQNYIVDSGKGGDPLRWITGQTHFNGELCECTHLMLDDKFQDLGLKGKKTLKMFIKEIAVAGSHRFEIKHQQAFNASPLWRMTLACNDDAESLSVIPELEGNIQNKISLLNCTRCDMPMPSQTSSERSKFWSQLTKEIPAFLHYVMNVHEVSEGMKDKEDRRMLVRGYHNPIATKLAEESSYDGQRMSAIKECLRKVQQIGHEWEGTPTELLDILKAKGIERNATPTSIGRLLTNRSKLPVDQVTYQGNKNGNRKYLINLREEE